MDKILFVNACVRENSRTLLLANKVLNNLKGEREEVNLYKTNLSPLTEEDLKLRAVASQNNDYSNPCFDLAKQFSKADVIVVAAPYWDLSFPAVVKSYFELITVGGLTFVYGEDGIPRGLCKAKRLIYVTTSGGPIFNNFGYEYVTAISKSFYGIKEFKLISAQGLDIKGANTDLIMQQALNSVNELL